MEFLLFFGSVFVSFGIVMTFRHLDRNNRSFDKVAKLSKNVKDEITLMTKDKLQEVRDYNNFIDASLQRGGVLLEELNKNLKLTEQKNSALQNDKVLNLLTKVENIEKTFDGINTQIAELNETKNFSKNSTKFIKETMHEMKTIKSEINILKKELDNKKSEVADVIKKQESKFVAEVEKNKKDVIVSLGKEKKYFDDNLSTYKKEIENINSLITGLKSNFIKQVEDEFDVMNRNYKLKSEEVKKEYASVEEETRKKLEEKIRDYSKYIVRIEERGENLSKKLDKDLNGAKDNYILDLKEGYTKLISELNKYNEEQRVRIKNEVASTYSDYENRYKKLISDIGNAEDNASSKLISYETFLKDSFDKLDKLKENTVDEIETKIEELNIHINNAKDMGIRLELEIFNEIKDKLDNFKSDTEGTIEKLKEGLDSKIKLYEGDIETRYDASNIKIKSVENSLEEFRGRFENELRNYTEILNKLDVDKNYFNENFKVTVGELKTNLEKEVASIKEFYGVNETKIKEDFSKTVSELEKSRENYKSASIEDMEKYKNIFNANMVKMKQYFEKETEKVFGNIDKMVSNVANKADGKTDELTKRFEVKYKEVEKRLLGVTDMMEEKSVELEGNILKKSAEVESEIDKKMKSVVENLYEKQENFEKEIRDIGINYELKLKSFTDDIDAVVNNGQIKVDEKISSINAKVEDFDGVIKKFISNMKDSMKEGEANYEKFVSALFNKTNEIEENFNNKAISIEREYFDKGEMLLAANNDKLSDFILKFDNLSENIASLKDSIDNEIDEKFKAGKVAINDLMERGSTNIIDSYKSLEEQTINKIEEYKNDLAKLKQNMKFLDEKFAKRFDDKLLDFDNKFNNKIEIFNEKYKTNIDDMYEKSKILEDKLSAKSAEIEENYFKKGEGLLNENKTKFQEFVTEFKGLKNEIVDLKSKIDDDVAQKILEGKNNINEQYKILEGETIKKINDYKNELLKIRQNMQQLDEKFISKFNEKVNDVDNRFELKILDMDKKFENEKSELSKKTDEILNDSRMRVDNFKEDFRRLKEEIDSLKSRIDDDVEQKIIDGKNQFTAIYQNEIEKLQDKYKSNEEVVISKLNDYKKEVFRIEQNMKQVDDRFTARFLEHSSILDKKISGIEDTMKKFEKSTGIFEKFDYMKDKLTEELDVLKNSLSEVKKERSDIVEIEKKMTNIRAVVKESDQKINLFLSDKKKIETLSQTITNLKDIADGAEEKIASLESAKNVISSLDMKIVNIETKLSSVENIYRNAAEKESEIQKSMESIGDIKNRSTELSKYLEVINRKYDDLEFKRNTFEKAFKNFEKDATLITKSESKVNDVIEKFNQMDALVEDLEQRTDSINRIREWLVKAETQIENLNHETDKRIKLLESLFDKVPESKIVKDKMKDDGNKKETVMRLRNQGWTIDDIAKTLDLSVGEVEFILDLELHRAR